MGGWWDWSEPTLVSFLLIMLLYATYQPLRFAIEDPERQARYASVFAITAGAFVPIDFVIVRLSTAYLHPRVLGDISANLPARFQVVFYLVADQLRAAVDHAVALRDDLQARQRAAAGAAADARRRRGRGAAAAQRGADAERQRRNRRRSGANPGVGTPR